MIESIELLGVSAWEGLWLPILIWTVPAGLVWLGVQSERFPAGLRTQLVQATLLALPLALIVSAVRRATAAIEYTVLTVPWPAPMPVMSPAEQPVAYTADPVWTAIGLLTILAVAGAIVGVGRLAASMISLAGLRASSRPVVDPQVRDLVRDYADEIGFNRRVEIRAVPGIASPMSAGVLRPVILIPESAPADLDLIVLHELIHHRRRDVVRTLVARFIRAVFFVHPLTHALCRRLDAFVEIDCDTEVVSKHGVSRKAYASLLLRYAVPRSSDILALKLGSEQSLLRKRLDAMQHPANMLRTHPVAVILGVLLLGAVTTFAACTDTFVGANDHSGDAAAYPQSDQEVFVIVEEMPKLIGGLEELQSKIEYPALARRAGVEGRVYVQFVVNMEGVPEDIVITRGIGAGADEEAVRVISTMRFTPGKQRGQIVPVKMSLPVSFRLDGRPLETTSTSMSRNSPSARTAVIYDSFDDVPYDFVTVGGTAREQNNGRTLTDEQVKGLAPAMSGTDLADVVRGGPSNAGHFDGTWSGERAVDESNFIIIRPRE